MMGIPRFGRMSRGIWRTAMTPASTTATMATTIVMGRRMAARGRVIVNESALREVSAAFDGEIVELDDRVRLGPEPDLARVLEGFVLRVKHLVAVIPDREVISHRFHLEDVPGVGGDLDAVVQEGPPLAGDRVVDRAVVFVGVAARDVVIVGILVSPDETEPLIDLAGQRPRPDGQGDVLVASFLQDCDGETVVRRVGALLNQDMVLVPALLDAYDPLAFGAVAGSPELESGRRGSYGVGLEVADHLVTRREGDGGAQHHGNKKSARQVLHVRPPFGACPSRRARAAADAGSPG